MYMQWHEHEHARLHASRGSRAVATWATHTHSHGSGSGSPQTAKRHISPKAWGGIGTRMWGLGVWHKVYGIRCAHHVLLCTIMPTTASQNTIHYFQLAVLYLSAFMASALTLDEYVAAATHKVQGAAPLAADAWRYVHPPLECVCGRAGSCLRRRCIFCTWHTWGSAIYLLALPCSAVDAAGVQPHSPCRLFRRTNAAVCNICWAAAHKAPSLHQGP